MRSGLNDMRLNDILYCCDVSDKFEYMLQSYKILLSLLEKTMQLIW